MLTIKTDKQGDFLKTKARLVLKGFQDKQKENQQTDSAASTRPGVRMSCQMAVSKSWNIFRVDLKTAFLQRQSYGVNRDVVCQLPREAGHSLFIGSRLKKLAPRWWNILDKALSGYGMVPTRADRCCYVLYSTPTWKRNWNKTCSTLGHRTIDISLESRTRSHRERDAAVEKMLDPIEGSPATGKSVAGITKLFVDDLFGTSGTEMEQRVHARLRKDFQGSLEDWNYVLFTGQRICWMKDPQSGPSLELGQERAIEELERVPVGKNAKEDLHCTPTMHRRYRSLLEQINWLQVSVLLQVFPMCFKGSSSDKWRCESSWQAGETAQVTACEISILATHRTVENNWISWCLLQKQWRWVFRDRHRSVFTRIARASSKNGMSCRSLVDYGSQKIRRTVLSTIVADLYSFMKCFGSCQFLRGLWMDLSGEVADIYMRTGAKNLVTRARTYLSKRKQSTWFPCCERKLVQEVFMILLTFQLRIVWQIVWQIIGEGRQLDHSSENSEIIRSWRSSKFQDTHGAQGLLVYMV